jgi:hypothetical protein
MNVQLFRTDDQILESGFLTILRSLHLSNVSRVGGIIS